MAKVFKSLFTDDDGFSSKDLILVCVMIAWMVTMGVGLFVDMSNFSFSQYEFVAATVTDMTMLVVLSTLGLQATGIVSNVIGKIGNRATASSSIKVTQPTKLVETASKQPEVNREDII